MRGCSEHCPSCGVTVATPLMFGDLNIEVFQRANIQPMIREYGEGGSDGSVFMGRGILSYQIQSQALVSVHAAYDRNIRRALDLLDIYYEVGTARRQVLLSTIYISIMTAYECLTDDLLKALQQANLAPVPKKRLHLHERRLCLLKVLCFEPGPHVTALRYLYAFRNCLTHNAGIVDHDFLKNIEQIGPIPPLLNSYAEGQPLILEPSAATSFADSVQQLAHALLPAAEAMCAQKENGGNHAASIRRPSLSAGRYL